jgi:hypothetical protein
VASQTNASFKYAVASSAPSSRWTWTFPISSLIRRPSSLASSCSGWPTKRISQLRLLSGACWTSSRRRARLDGNRPRTHPTHSGRKATKVRPPFSEREKRPKDSDALDGDELGRLCRTLTGWPTTDARVDGQARIGGAL